MAYYYRLEIQTTSDDQIALVDNIMGIKSGQHPVWILEVVEKEDDEPVFFIDYFLSVLEGKYEQLEQIGIARDDIVIWMLYEYDGQCNMEFSPDELKRLGERGIRLCISCWEKEDPSVDVLYMCNLVWRQDIIVGKIISALKSTDDHYHCSKTALTLVEHFKDERIEPCLVELAKDPRWKNCNESLLYALAKYTNDPKYLYFLVDLLLKYEKSNDGEIFADTYDMLLNLHPPLDGKEIRRTLQRVRREEKKKNLSDDQRKTVHLLLNWLEGQREITRCYKRFGRRGVAGMNVSLNKI
jgi:hypothetical protein